MSVEITFLNPKSSLEKTSLVRKYSLFKIKNFQRRRKYVYLFFSDKKWLSAMAPGAFFHYGI